MGKWDPYSRRELRRRRARWVRRNLALIAVVTVGLVAVGGLSTWSLSFSLSGPSEAYIFGGLHVGIVALLLHMLNSPFLASDREALWHVRGAWGEENTRDELRRAKRRRLVWGWVDSISLKAGDLDHVVVTRRGGLVVIDSKWRNQVTRDDTAQMTRSAQKAKSRAEAVARTVLKSEPGARHRAKAHPPTVTPVVVLWGAAQASVPADAEIDGVRFITGRQLIPWLRTLGGDEVPKDAARDLLAKLRAFRGSASQAN